MTDQVVGYGSVGVPRKLGDIVLNLCSIGIGLTVSILILGGLLFNPIMNLARRVAGLSELSLANAFSVNDIIHFSKTPKHLAVLVLCLLAGTLVSIVWRGTAAKEMLRKGIIMLFVSSAAFYATQIQEFAKPWIIPGKYGAAYIFIFYMSFWIPTWIGYLLGEAYIVGFRRLFWKEKV